MRAFTGDKTADFLIGQIRFLSRVGDLEHKRRAAEWEQIIRRHAKPESIADTVNFATDNKEQEATRP